MSTRTFTFTVQSSSLPAWVPIANAVASYAGGGSTLRNGFVSVVAPYYEAFYSKKVINDYSAGVANPHIGSYGGIIFRGGGHAATNDNGIYGLIPDATGLQFYRLSDPTAYFGTGTSQATKDANSLSSTDALNDNTYGDALPAVDTERQPRSAHTYGYGDIIPPSDGGAALGTFFSALTGGAAIGSGEGRGGAHYLTLTNGTGQSGNAWTRASSQTFPIALYNTLPIHSEYVSPQRRSYVMGRGSTAVHWFDHQSQTVVQGTGTAFGFNTGSLDSGRMIYVPSRNLLIGMTAVSNTLRVQWMDVSVSQPTVNGTATLSATVHLPSVGWAQACWCPDNNRIIVGNTLASAGGASDQTTLTEIEIPTTLTNAWTVTRRALSSGSVIWNQSVGSWQGLDYLPALKSIIYFPRANDSIANDRVYVIRPFGT